ncbi:imidazolonepropionase [Notoacmeibacter sp. MSK16QG-6]|uniref:imidazolonepropionase n=1 Tax=Notoacmeibacter sp. MSK16QG-6 TaxID=2957982 RepID=UPI0020A1EDE7|nr:imidazolonepropionase [Notoacmeibacter sp. MSK16QG-6]MCP1200527.1 imidazolonepropionase [Notoacmeibacter sp. MSK16QG-6]
MLLVNARLATMVRGSIPYGLIDRAAIAIEDGKILWCGREAELPTTFGRDARQDLGGGLVTPALIDCHTHLVFGGNRAQEFELRLNGASYEDVARNGGGILSTVMATREADEDSLLADALTRVDALIAEGVATIEVKSGYGLTVADELKMLRVARRIADERPVRIRTSYLAAHAIPPEFKGSPNAYLERVVLPGLEQAHTEGLVDAVDGFCESIAFAPHEIEQVFDKAQGLGLPVKLHAEQLSSLGGAALAARHGALSADHLEYLDAAGVTVMAQSGTVAVLLPGAFYTLRETQLPPVNLLRNEKVPIALATDCNPGSSPLASILLAMNMGATLFRLTPQETLAGTTRNAARALGLEDCGVIAPGKRADLAIWNVADPAELSYRIGFNALHRRIFGGDFS